MELDEIRRNQYIQDKIRRNKVKLDNIKTKLEK